MLQTRSAIFYILLLSILSPGCTQKDNACCIKVGESCIRLQDIKDRIERFADESSVLSQDVLQKMKPVIVENIIEEQLIINYAKNNHIEVSDEEIDIAIKGITEGLSREDFNTILMEQCRDISDIRGFVKKRSIANKALGKAIGQGEKVSGDDIKRYYDEHKADYYRPATVELYHVFVKDQLKAKEALIMLRSGVSISKVASRYSDVADERNLGFMGVFSRGDLPKEVEDVVFSIPERRYSRIIETQSGYHIFYVANRTDPGILPFLSAADEIKEMLREERFEYAYKCWIAQLKNKYRIEVYWDEINSISIEE